MTTTILTDEQIERGREATFSTNNPYCPCDSKTMRKAARWAEQAVLQSPEVQAWKRDSAMLDWLDGRACCADWVEDEPIKRVIQHEDGDEFYGATWRDAIGAAMEKQP